MLSQAHYVKQEAGFEKHYWWAIVVKYSKICQNYLYSEPVTIVNRSVIVGDKAFIK